MDGNLYTEQLIFHYILGNTLYVDKCRAEYFSLAYVRAAFCVVKPHIIRFNEVPSGPQVIELMKQSGATLISPQDQQSVTEEIILSLWQYRSKLREYSEDWLKDQTDCFLTFKSMMWGLEQTISYVKSTRNDVDVTNYKEITDKVKNIFTRETSIELTDSGRGYDLYDPKAHKTKQMARFSTGYQFIDLCAKGGYWEGSLWVFLGAPKAGKSRWLQNLMAQSLRMGNNCAYISMELQEEMIIQRVGANILNIPLDDYDKYSDDEMVIGQKINEFLQSPDFQLRSPGRCIVKTFPTSAVSVNDIEAWLLKEEERISQETGKPFKFKNVYLDYINIMRNWRNPNTENTYMKIKQIAEDARASAQKNHWCIVTATQVKQAYFDQADMDMAAASESSALAATVDMMFGIISDSIMKAQGKCYLKSLALRVSGHVNERKEYLVDGEHFRLTEGTSPIIYDEDIIKQTITKTSAQIIKSNSNRSKKYLQGQNATSQTQAQPLFVVGTGNSPQIVTPQLGVTELKTTGEGLFD